MVKTARSAYVSCDGDVRRSWTSRDETRFTTHLVTHEEAVATVVGLEELLEVSEPSWHKTGFEVVLGSLCKFGQNQNE